MSLNQIEPKWTNRQSLKNTKCYVFTWKIRLTHIAAVFDEKLKDS